MTELTELPEGPFTRQQAEVVASLDWPPESPDNQYHLNK